MNGEKLLTYFVMTKNDCINKELNSFSALLTEEFISHAWLWIEHFYKYCHLLILGLLNQWKNKLYIVRPDDIPQFSAWMKCIWWYAEEWKEDMQKCFMDRMDFKQLLWWIKCMSHWVMSENTDYHMSTSSFFREKYYFCGLVII